MKKVSIVLAVIFLILLTIITVNTYDNSKGVPTVKGLQLKFVLIDSAFEVYENFILEPTPFNREFYEEIGETEHYNWLASINENLSAQDRQLFKIVFESISITELFTYAETIDDSARYDKIIERYCDFIKTKENEALAERMADLFLKFYKSGFNTYFKDNYKKYEVVATKLTKQIKSNNKDILEFMEKQSGLKFKKRLKPEFGILLRPIGAIGITTDTKFISLCPYTAIEMDTIYATGFHEYGHKLFAQIAETNEFNMLCDRMQKESGEFVASYETYKYAYSWYDYCEENLIEGFADYLQYKLTGKADDSLGLYFCDKDFYEYLIRENFNPNKKSLLDTSVEFYEVMINSEG